MSLELKYPIWLLCEIAGISPSSYYKYKNKPLDKTDEIENLVIEVYNKSSKRAGYRSVKDILKNQYNLNVNHKKVQRIMRENDLYSIIRKKNKKRTREKANIKENILSRDFKADEPYKKFATDITYIPTKRQMVYLCTVIDLFNNEPVAWHISDTIDKDLSVETIKQLSKKCNLKGSLIHSDQGVNYTCYKYVSLLEKLEVTQSMSRRGNCWDNAKAESFFSHYKCETVKIMKKQIHNIHDVIRITNEYMDYYINFRPQKALGGLTPSAYKKQLLHT